MNNLRQTLPDLLLWLLVPTPAHRVDTEPDLQPAVLGRKLPGDCLSCHQSSDEEEEGSQGVDLYDVVCLRYSLHSLDKLIVLI